MSVPFVSGNFGRMERALCFSTNQKGAFAMPDYRNKNGVEATTDDFAFFELSFSSLKSGRILSKSCVILSRDFLDGNFVLLN